MKNIQTLSFSYGLFFLIHKPHFFTNGLGCCTDDNDDDENNFDGDEYSASQDNNDDDDGDDDDDGGGDNEDDDEDGDESGDDAQVERDLCKRCRFDGRENWTADDLSRQTSS